MKNISEILLIGPCANKKDITNTGGIIILFEDLLYQMRKSNISFMLVDTNKKNYPNIFFAMVSIYLKIIIKSFYVKQVSIHGTAKDYLYIAPFTIFFANLINKNVSTRKFAGNFNSYYKSINNSTNIIYIIGLVFICINVVTNTQLLKDYDMNKVILYSTITRIFFTMIISVCFLKEDLTNKQKLGYFIIIIGFLLVHNK